MAKITSVMLEKTSKKLSELEQKIKKKINRYL
jgi:hypothetical protein